jgi:hypothetical protein
VQSAPIPVDPAHVTALRNTKCFGRAEEFERLADVEGREYACRCFAELVLSLDDFCRGCWGPTPDELSIALRAVQGPLCAKYVNIDLSTTPGRAISRALAALQKQRLDVLVVDSAPDANNDADGADASDAVAALDVEWLVCPAGFVQRIPVDALLRLRRIDVVHPGVPMLLVEIPPEFQGTLGISTPWHKSLHPGRYLTTKRAGTTMELARSHQAIGYNLSGVIPLLTGKVLPYSVRHRSGWGATALAGVQLRESKRIRAWWHHVVSIANLQPPVTTCICKAACQHPAPPCYPPTTTLP